MSVVVEAVAAPVKDEGVVVVVDDDDCLRDSSRLRIQSLRRYLSTDEGVFRRGETSNDNCVRTFVRPSIQFNICA